MPEPGKKFAMVYLDTITKLSPTAAGRTQLMVYCFLRAEYGNIQHGKDGSGKHWFYASWGEVADRLSMDRTTIKRAARALQKADLLDIREHTRRSIYPCDANFMRVKPYLAG